MDNESQKRWERIQQALAAELSGEAKPRVSSGRTLFGIKSEGETKMDAFAKQIEEEYAAKRQEHPYRGIRRDANTLLWSHGK